MTTMTATPQTRRPAPTIAMLAPTPTATEVGFGSLVRVEARKHLNTRTGFWMGLITLALTLAATIGGAFLFKTISNATGSTSWMQLISVAGFVINIAVPVGVMLNVTQEWTQRTAQTTFTAEPRRARVVLAKGVVALAAAVVGFVATVAFTALAAALGGATSGLDVTWNVSARGLGANLMVLVLSTLMAFGFALLMMNVAAIVTYFALPTVVPMLGLAGSKVQQVLEWTDLTTASGPILLGEATATDWAQLGVASLIWVMVPIALGTWRHLHREVN